MVIISFFGPFEPNKSIIQPEVNIQLKLVK